MELADNLEVIGGNASAGVERGELFEYQLSSPVSVKRGGSAMVPLAAAKPETSKQRIWRDGAGSNPDLVVRFDNDTDGVLEEGPLVVYDEGGYAGEAMLPYSARGAEVKLAYAKDLAVRCRRDSATTHEIAGVRLGNIALIEERRVCLVHSLRAESDHDEPVAVIFELPKVHGRELDRDGAEPIEETASCRRFELSVPAHEVAKLEVREIWRTQQHIRYRDMSARHLKQWLADKHLDQHSFEALSEVLRATEGATKLDQERQQVEGARQAMFEKQSKISEQLGVLRDTGDEGELRLRYVRELGAAQDKVNQYEERIRLLRARADELRSQAERLLQELTRPSRDG